MPPDRPWAGLGLASGPPFRPCLQPWFLAGPSSGLATLLQRVRGERPTIHGVEYDWVECWILHGDSKHESTPGIEPVALGFYGSVILGVTIMHASPELFLSPQKL